MDNDDVNEIINFTVNLVQMKLIICHSINTDLMVKKISCEHRFLNKLRNVVVEKDSTMYSSWYIMN